MTGLAIIVPLYRNAELIPDFVQSLLDIAMDLTELCAHVIFVNDSPDDSLLMHALETHLQRLDGRVELLINDENLGFIRSCNRGLAMALKAGEDAVLLNSDALLTPGALLEMSAVSLLDPMIGFVSPRSNNATICNSPYPDRFRSLSPAEAGATHREIEALLPRVSYVPTAVGFCLLIKQLMLLEFGLLDDVYGDGYNEENDLIMRCNRRGYRAVLANRAFVHHLGGASFSLTERSISEREDMNREKLLQRFPEYSRSVHRFFHGVDYTAQYLLAGLVKEASGRRRVLFECSHMGLFHNGTFELAINVMREFARRHSYHYECWVCCDHTAFLFHGLHLVQELAYAGTRAQALSSSPYMAVIRLAQPFSLQDLVDIARLAPITGFLILDTIALDCQNLDTPDLMAIWNWMLQTTALVGYISEFSQQQFRSRFRVPPAVTEAVVLLSTDTDDYAAVDSITSVAPESQTDAGEYVLVIGNHFAHKSIRETVELFRQQPDSPTLVVLGMDFECEDNLVSYRSGELDNELVQRLYRRSRIVLFPSHYEGFGLPIMHALAHRKPVIARDLPVFAEIKVRTRHHANLHLLPTTRAMVEMARGCIDWVADDTPPALPEQSWGAAADALERGLVDACRRLSFDDLCRRLHGVVACEALIGSLS